MASRNSSSGKRTNSNASGRSGSRSSSAGSSASRSASGNGSRSRGTSSEAKKTSNTGRKTAPSEPETNGSEVSFADYLHAFTKTKVFPPVIIILSTVAIVLLDLLFAWNKYDTFFKILGFELLFLAVIGMFIFILGMSTTVPQKKERDDE
ncbi:MAG: hypothetical protein J5685_07520 [Clostridiales bacterium]|nr:hypothetical protein [Clostridiales bacterium]